MPIEKINPEDGYNNRDGVVALSKQGDIARINTDTLSTVDELNLAVQASGNYQYRFDDYGLRRKTVNIGSWNMDSIYFKKVINPIAIADKWKNTRALNLVVRNDSDATYYTADTAPGVSGLTDVSVSGIGSTHITLQRRDGGYFDSSSFSASANRGWITVWYD